MTWTGSEVIVWGGFDLDDARYLNDGGRYDPGTDTWDPLSIVGAPSPRSRHTAMWTGSRYVIWGGGRLEGGIGDIHFEHATDFASLDPGTNQWRRGEESGAPTARSDHSAVWTGSEVIVWGGWSGRRFEQYLLETGAGYDPVADSWRPLPLSGAPGPRALHTAAWTGRELLVWGGDVLNGTAQSGGRYDPVSNEWTALPEDNGPGGGQRQAAAWSGEAFYVIHDVFGRAFEEGVYALDGLPDDWQYQYFGEQNPEGAADRDPDADGQDNFMEFLTGTSPTNSTEWLQFSVTNLPSESSLRFRIFPGHSGRRYGLEQSTQLSTRTWVIVNGEWLDPGDQSRILTLPLLQESTPRFFRVRVSIE